jgi:hypothetical protein
MVDRLSQAAPLIDTLRTILGDDLEKILGTRLNRMDELEALVALYQEYGADSVKRVVENALTTYLDQVGRRRHYEKVSAIAKLNDMRRMARADAEYAEFVAAVESRRQAIAKNGRVGGKYIGKLGNEGGAK